MVITTTLTSKGQLTVPKAIRERMGLNQGDRILFIEEENAVRIARLPEDTDVEALFGRFEQWEGEPDISRERVRERMLEKDRNIRQQDGPDSKEQT